MDKFVIRKSSMTSEETSQRQNTNQEQVHASSKKSRVETDLNDLPSDPGLRIKILDYDPNDREKVRRAYLQKGPCQPRSHSFPQRMIGKVSRRSLMNDCLVTHIEKDLFDTVDNELIIHRFQNMVERRGLL